MPTPANAAHARQTPAASSQPSPTSQRGASAQQAPPAVPHSRAGGPLSADSPAEPPLGVFVVPPLPAPLPREPPLPEVLPPLPPFIAPAPLAPPSAPTLLPGARSSTL